MRTAASDEAKVFHTHQLLLSLQSEVFESLLRNQSVLTLHEPPETAALFEKFIRYLRTPRDGDSSRDAAPVGTAGTLWDGDARRDVGKEGRGSSGDHGGMGFVWGCRHGGRMLLWGLWGLNGKDDWRNAAKDGPLGVLCGMGITRGM